jgi:hypothetical protein
MNKAECLKKAEAAAHTCNVITARAAMYASAFGGSDKLTQDALRDRDVAAEVSIKWQQIAKMHPATRRSMLAKRQLPAYMFGY